MDLTTVGHATAGAPLHEPTRRTGKSFDWQQTHSLFAPAKCLSFHRPVRALSLPEVQDLEAPGGAGALPCIRLGQWRGGDVWFRHHHGGIPQIWASGDTSCTYVAQEPQGAVNSITHLTLRNIYTQSALEPWRAGAARQKVGGEVGVREKKVRTQGILVCHAEWSEQTSWNAPLARVLSGCCVPGDTLYFQVPASAFENWRKQPAVSGLNLQEVLSFERVLQFAQHWAPLNMLRRPSRQEDLVLQRYFPGEEPEILGFLDAGQRRTLFGTPVGSDHLKRSALRGGFTDASDLFALCDRSGHPLVAAHLLDAARGGFHTWKPPSGAGKRALASVQALGSSLWDHAPLLSTARAFGVPFGRSTGDQLHVLNLSHLAFAEGLEASERAGVFQAFLQALAREGVLRNWHALTYAQDPESPLVAGGHQPSLLVERLLIVAAQLLGRGPRGLPVSPSPGLFPQSLI